MPIVFAAISPHPPIILPDVGSPKDRVQVKNTIESLENLGKELKELKPDFIIISAPHPDWGFEVPLFFLANNFQGKVEKILIGSESPQSYFEKGTKFLTSSLRNSKIAIIASGDLSHCLKKDGPYGFQADGPKFDKELIESLKKKDVVNILKLDDKYPEAGECGLRSFCLLLGILEANSKNSGQEWKPEILSYEGPFGVGYLVANFKLR